MNASSLSRAARLAYSTAIASLLLGGPCLVFGLEKESITLWTFGAACLLQVPLALSLGGRIRNGLGNHGLDRERRFLRITSHLTALLALAAALTSAAALFAHRMPEESLAALGLGTLAVLIQGTVWSAKRGLAETHPSLALDLGRARMGLELALLGFAALLLSPWFPWADACLGLAMALRLFLESRSLAKGTSVAGGGCGTGCGCR